MNRYLYYIAVCAVLISCRTSKHEKPETSENSNQQSDTFIQSTIIAPGQCRILGTVVKIDSVLDTENPASLCAKSPCNAIIRIDSVLGYGSSFPKPLSAGNTIPVKFMFTLSSITLELPEGKSESYPGLAEGSQFITDVRSQTAMQSDGANNTSYLIYGYKRY